MNHFTTKQLAFVGRTGPAFSLNEIPSSHDVLDRIGVPRRLNGADLTLPERIWYLNGMLSAVRSLAAIEGVVIVSILERYHTMEVKS